MNNEKLVLSLFRIGVIKFGKFTLKSGIISPVYIDLRVLVSYPRVLKEVGKAYLPILRKLKFDRMVAVPYAGIPLVAVVSFLNNKPWVYTRKEVKNYGITKPMEGEFKKGERAVIVDDIVTDGASKLEVIGPIKKAGLEVRDVVVLIDRDQGGKKLLSRKGYRLHSALTLPRVFEILLEKRKITNVQYEESVEFLRKNAKA